MMVDHAGVQLPVRRRVELALGRRNSGATPFVIWNNKLPDEETTQRLLEAGACIVVKSNVYHTSLKTIETEEETWLSDDGHKKRKVVYHTPCGELEEECIVATGSIMPIKPMFKTEKDYDAILSLVRDYEYSPCYDEFRRDDAKYGEYGLARPATEKSPFFQIIYDFMGVMNFSMEWFDNRDRVLGLYNALLECREKRLELLANSPAQYAVIDGNVEMSVIGPHLFEAYYAPAIESAARNLHESGILAGVHLDGNNRRLLSLMARSAVDVIESFTPPPDCDTELSTGLSAWPDKAFIVNIPASLHARGREIVTERARAILREGRGTGRVILGVLEDIPANDHLVQLAELIAMEG